MKVFIAGIGTDVGKTIVSAILCEALEADYWKPIQAGNLGNSDTLAVKRLVSNNKSSFHPESYRFKLAASPHRAADAENKKVRLDAIMIPKTSNHLIIEGAGGLLVPLNQKMLMIDLIKKFEFPVVLVSRHYLGSINHTLLSIEALKSRRIKILGIIFNGNENKYTENVILDTGIRFIGRVKNERSVNEKIVTGYAKKFKVLLKEIIV